ncbi:MAG TPA: hypothetical protein VF108_07350, partial [Actinomycetota bacterium]
MQAGLSAAFERAPRRRVAAEVLFLALLLALVVPIGAFAGKGGGGSGVQPWIGLNGVTDENGRLAAAAGDPSLGDYVTFSTVVPKNVNNPRIEVLCYQAGELVFGMAGGTDYAFLLGGGGSTWKDNGGGADCVANLYYFSWKANTPTATRL